jgi:hypothetical protein
MWTNARRRGGELSRRETGTRTSAPAWSTSLGGSGSGPGPVRLGWSQRLRLVGPNGSGKTTLIDALLGREPLRAGTRYAGPSVVFGELDQSRRLFSTAEPVLDVVRHQAGGRRSRWVSRALSGLAGGWRPAEEHIVPTR